jgi:phosphoglycolate phosphatase
MFDLIMFDLDGTLVDTAGEIGDTVNDVLRALRLPPASDELVRTWVGQGSRELLIRACAHAAGLAQEDVRASATMESVIEMYGRFHEKHCGTRSHVYPHVVDTLTELSARGVATALVTNREARFAEAVLRAHGLHHFFNPIICGDSLPVKKPDAATVEHCLRLHGVPKERALLIGDSGVDVATGRNAGVACWAVPYGYNSGLPIEDANPERVIVDISAVLAATRSQGHADAPPQTHHSAASA